ncbi:MAG: hypothetical protein ACJ8BW_25055 [Ktedonobacteraceae bacterium]
MFTMVLDVLSWLFLVLFCVVFFRVLVLHSVDFLAGYGYVEGKPKTAAGKRVISLPTFLLDMLKHHQVQQLALRKASDNWEDRDLVFP